MKIQALAQFTKQQSLAGSDSAEVLDKFLLYAKLCRDPANIFQYMQEKAICTFISHYWVAKADYYAQIGDYQSAFQYIKQAQTRTGISEEEEQKIVHPQLHLCKYKKQIISQIKRQPISGKRSAQQFQFVSTQQQSMSGDQQKKNEKLLKLWNSKYSYVRKEKEKKAQLKRQTLPYSWLYEVYKQKEQKSKKISQTIKNIFHHVQNMEQGKNHRSLNTPFTKKDPKRISKTIDSVQMLKRKKSTGEKIHKKNEYEGQASEQDNQEINSQTTRFVQSIPVGKNFSLLKKHVTFRKEASNIQKFRKRGAEYQKSACLSLDGKSQNSQFNVLRKSIIRNSSKSPSARDLTTPMIQKPCFEKQQQTKNEKNKQ